MRLSKSRFLSGLQCHKRLFLEVHAPELATQADAMRQAMLDMGNEIGKAARLYFPGGVLVEEDYRHATAAMARTAELLADSQVPAIFEGAFQFDGTLVRVDVLERVDATTWRLIEVKAASRVKSVHVNDLSVQAYVLQGNGLELGGMYLMHVNRHYGFVGGAIDYQQLFALQDMTEAVEERLPQVASQLHQMKGVLSTPSPPVVEPDTHCHSPYSCSFWDYCTREKSDRWIFHLPGEKKVFRQLKSMGIELMDDIPSSHPLSVLQRRVKENVEWISPTLADELRAVTYPVHHLDFETFMPAIPHYPNTRPYQPLPVQWSNHIESEDGQLRHEAFLCRDQKDPREELATRLLASVGDKGSICVYSEYERFVLLSLAEVLPHLRQQLRQVVSRLWDLLSVLQHHYYHPQFGGSFSIKSVLPSLVPSLGYQDLEIQDGSSASSIYYRVVFRETDWVERERLANALLQYCERDTLAMVEIRRVLHVKANTLSVNP
jgi:CRISPR/Cas system-associated exonuclease Cas4 (RecB family)